MTNMLAQGNTMLGTALDSHVSQDAVYWRGTQSDDVRITPGATDAETTDEDGVMVQSSIADFIIPLAQMTSEPQAGDVIVVGGRKYEVIDLAGEGPWRWSDRPYNSRYRVHTQDVGAS